MISKSKLAMVLTVFVSCVVHDAWAVVGPVPMKYAPLYEVQPTILDGACAVTVVSVSDERPNKETIGPAYNKSLTTEDPAPWVKNALNELKAYGFTVHQASQPVPGSIGLSATLFRAYTWPLGMTINGMVAMRVDISPGSGSITEKKYRGFGSKTNMWGADGEFVTTLNYAVNDLVANLANDLQMACKNQQHADTTPAI